jgi:two-component system cell cycle sensor histidine kinase/response regulator CckA
MIERGDSAEAAAGATGSRGPKDAMLVGLALAASAALLIVAHAPLLVTAGFVGGLAVLATIALLIARRPVVAAPVAFAAPDWSVTHAAIDREDEALAITDRAGRLQCANRRFTEWFGLEAAPTRLPVDPPFRERLESAARAAWRDGAASVPLLAMTSEGGAGANGEVRRWRLELLRAGRGEDHLVWRFLPQDEQDLVADAAAQIAGKLGRALGRSAIEAAVVAPDGAILAANTAFAARAVGDPHAVVAGKDFVGFFRADEHDSVVYAREGARGTPVRMVHLPISDPDQPADPDPAKTPSLFLLIDNQGQDGQGYGAGGRTGLPQVEALLARLPLGLAMTDRDGRFLFANGAFLRAAGIEGTVPPPYPADLVIREDKGALSDAVRRFTQGSGTAGDVAVRLHATPDEPVSLTLASVRGLGDGAVLLSLKDSSEETRLKREIAQATKMQAVGQLAGGVAHDFNNVLTAIIGCCDLMLMRHTPGDSDYLDIQQIKANSNRAASLTRQLLAFSRQQTLRPEVLQLPDVVSEVSALLKRLIGEKIQFKVSHDRDLGLVRADPVQLEQVLLNLAVNARDAMAGRVGGVLTIATKRVTMQDVRAMKSEILPVDDYTALIVEDNGSGIKPLLLGKIFEPFFTTKDKGKGTGLGLSTVYGIVKQSGGFIFATSDVDKGTRFSIYLPVYVPNPAEVAANAAEAKAAAEAKSAEPPRDWAPGGRILLVEDEDTVRAVAERALTRQGYEVTAASDGDEGLEIITNGGDFDLVLSDVVMPVMDGPAMARAIREARPDLPVLFMSGYAEEQLRREIDIPNMFFLPKPFSVQQIVEAVEAVLRSR